VGNYREKKAANHGLWRVDTTSKNQRALRQSRHSTKKNVTHHNYTRRKRGKKQGEKKRKGTGKVKKKKEHKKNGDTGDHGVGRQRERKKKSLKNAIAHWESPAATLPDFSHKQNISPESCGPSAPIRKTLSVHSFTT